jgi:hypothetical protein
MLGETEMPFAYIDECGRCKWYYARRDLEERLTGHYGFVSRVAKDLRKRCNSLSRARRIRYLHTSRASIRETYLVEHALEPGFALVKWVPTDRLRHLT